MNSKQFDILLQFHKGLIRSHPHQKTIDAARSGVKDGASGKLLVALNSRKESLKQWNKSATSLTKRNIYNKNNTRNPSQGAFDGAFAVIDNGKAISKAATAAKVNYQSVKVLIPRIERWNEYAKKLAVIF